MKLLAQALFSTLFIAATFARADIIVLHDGVSYSGRFTPPANGKLAFTDNKGIGYQFPVSDIQSLVFSNTADNITLHNGKNYSGQLNGEDTILFEGSGGIDYQFPVRDVSSVILTGSPAPAASRHVPSLVIPEGTNIVVLTSNSIEAGPDSSGQLYPATIQQTVMGSSGRVAIPQGTHAKLVVSNVRSGGAVSSADLILDLYSIELDGVEYRVDSSSVTEGNKSGLGANRRTAVFAGGGAGLGALMGAVFGGGRGAGIGALAGAGGGALTQLFTRGKKISVPAETSLTFRLEQTLVLHP